MNGDIPSIECDERTLVDFGNPIAMREVDDDSLSIAGSENFTDLLLYRHDSILLFRCFVLVLVVGFEPTLAEPKSAALPAWLNQIVCDEILNQSLMTSLDPG